MRRSSRSTKGHTCRYQGYEVSGNCFMKSTRITSTPKQSVAGVSSRGQISLPLITPPSKPNNRVPSPRDASLYRSEVPLESEGQHGLSTEKESSALPPLPLAVTPLLDHQQSKRRLLGSKTDTPLSPPAIVTDPNDKKIPGKNTETFTSAAASEDSMLESGGNEAETLPTAYAAHARAANKDGIINGVSPPPLSFTVKPSDSKEESTSDGENCENSSVSQGRESSEDVASTKSRFASPGNEHNEKHSDVCARSREQAPFLGSSLSDNSSKCALPSLCTDKCSEVSPRSAPKKHSTTEQNDALRNSGGMDSTKIDTLRTDGKDRLYQYSGLQCAHDRKSAQSINGKNCVDSLDLPHCPSMKVSTACAMTVLSNRSSTSALTSVNVEENNSKLALQTIPCSVPVPVDGIVACDKRKTDSDAVEEMSLSDSLMRRSLSSTGTYKVDTAVTLPVLQHAPVQIKNIPGAAENGPEEVLCHKEGSRPACIDEPEACSHVTKRSCTSSPKFLETSFELASDADANVTSSNGLSTLALPSANVDKAFILVSPPVLKCSSVQASCAPTRIGDRLSSSGSHGQSIDNEGDSCRMERGSKNLCTSGNGVGSDATEEKCIISSKLCLSSVGGSVMTKASLFHGESVSDPSSAGLNGGKGKVSLAVPQGSPLQGSNVASTTDTQSGCKRFAASCTKEDGSHQLEEKSMRSCATERGSFLDTAEATCAIEAVGKTSYNLENDVSEAALNASYDLEHSVSDTVPIFNGTERASLPTELFTTVHRAAGPGENNSMTEDTNGINTAAELDTSCCSFPVRQVGSPQLHCSNQHKNPETRRYELFEPSRIEDNEDVESVLGPIGVLDVDSGSDGRLQDANEKGPLSLPVYFHCQERVCQRGKPKNVCSDLNLDFATRGIVHFEQCKKDDTLKDTMKDAVATRGKGASAAQDAQPEKKGKSKEENASDSSSNAITGNDEDLMGAETGDVRSDGGDTNTTLSASGSDAEDEAKTSCNELSIGDTKPSALPESELYDTGSGDGTEQRRRFFGRANLPVPYRNFAREAMSSREGSSSKWTVQIGDTVCVHLEDTGLPHELTLSQHRRRKALSKEEKKWFPFWVPWSPCQVLTIYQVVGGGRGGNNGDGDSTGAPGSFRAKVRWLYRRSDMAANVHVDDSHLTAVGSDHLEEVFESDHTTDVDLESMLGRVRLVDLNGKEVMNATGQSEGGGAGARVVAVAAVPVPTVTYLSFRFYDTKEGIIVPIKRRGLCTSFQSFATSSVGSRPLFYLTKPVRYMFDQHILPLLKKHGWSFPQKAVGKSGRMDRLFVPPGVKTQLKKRTNYFDSFLGFMQHLGNSDCVVANFAFFFLQTLAELYENDRGHLRRLVEGGNRDEIIKIVRFKLREEGNPLPPVDSVADTTCVLSLSNEDKQVKESVEGPKRNENILTSSRVLRSSTNPKPNTTSVIPEPANAGKREATKVVATAAVAHSSPSERICVSKGNAKRDSLLLFQSPKFGKVFDRLLLPAMKEIGWTVSYTRGPSGKENKRFLLPGTANSEFYSRTSLMRKLIEPRSPLVNGLRDALEEVSRSSLGMSLSALRKRASSCSENGHQPTERTVAPGNQRKRTVAAEPQTGSQHAENQSSPAQRRNRSPQQLNAGCARGGQTETASAATLRPTLTGIETKKCKRKRGAGNTPVAALEGRRKRGRAPVVETSTGPTVAESAEKLKSIVQRKEFINVFETEILLLLLQKGWSNCEKPAKSGKNMYFFSPTATDSSNPYSGGVGKNYFMSRKEVVTVVLQVGNPLSLGVRASVLSALKRAIGVEEANHFVNVSRSLETPNVRGAKRGQIENASFTTSRSSLTGVEGRNYGNKRKAEHAQSTACKRPREKEQNASEETSTVSNVSKGHEKVIYFERCRDFIEAFDDRIKPLLLQKGWSIRECPRTLGNRTDMYYFPPEATKSKNSYFKSRKAVVSALLEPGSPLGRGVQASVLAILKHAIGTEGVRHFKNASQDTLEGAIPQDHQSVARGTSQTPEPRFAATNVANRKHRSSLNITVLAKQDSPTTARKHPREQEATAVAVTLADSSLEESIRIVNSFVRKKEFIQAFENVILPLLLERGWSTCASPSKSGGGKNMYFFPPKATESGNRYSGKVGTDYFMSRKAVLTTLLKLRSPLGQGVRKCVIDALKDTIGKDNVRHLINVSKDTAKRTDAHNYQSEARRISKERSAPPPSEQSTVHNSSTTAKRKRQSGLKFHSSRNTTQRSKKDRKASKAVAAKSTCFRKHSVGQGRTPRVHQAKTGMSDICTASDVRMKHPVKRKNGSLQSQPAGHLGAGGAIVTNITMTSHPKVDTFLSWWSEGRMIEVENENVEVAFQLWGRKYELMSAKVDDEDTNRGRGRKRRTRLAYVATSGPGLRAWNLQHELEKIADFRSLPPNKAVARLELFQTPCGGDNFWIDELTKEDVEEIPEDNHMGCGFISEVMFQELLGNTAEAQRSNAMQIRMFAPQFGLFKGVLCTRPGISGIQLPTSMRKVGPSRRSHQTWVVMLARALFPSQCNYYLGRYLDPKQDDPPKSFERDYIRKLSEMYHHLLKGLGVPSKSLKDYTRASMKRCGLRHSHLVGLRDPTNKLLQGHVFISGFDKDASGNRQNFVKGKPKVFVTRSPCLEPTDGKILPVVTSKPSCMSKSHWDWLCKQPFGCIYFASPKNPALKPLPETIADGDLDGDLYFVLWDKEIVSHLSQPEVQRIMKSETRVHSSKKCEVEKQKGSSTWLEDVQELLADTSRSAKINELKGKLYNHSMNTAKDSDEHICDPDARAYARAFKNTLDMPKHGGRAGLPTHLHYSVPERLHDLL